MIVPVTRIGFTISLLTVIEIKKFPQVILKLNLLDFRRVLLYIGICNLIFQILYLSRTVHTKINRRRKEADVMHGPSLLMVLSSIFAAGSIRVAVVEAGIPIWVWAVLILMLGFLIWWWLRKPVDEVSSPGLAERPDNNPFPSVLPVITGAVSAPSSLKPQVHRVSHGPTPQPLTAESPAPSEPEEDRDQKLPVVPPMEVKPDDLTIVEGIGPKINQVLHAAGIQSLFQLSESEVTQLKEILTAAGVRLADITTWSEQARLAAAGDIETLKALQATLKGDRRV